MSWKSLVTASLLCVLASPAFAAPGLVITGGVRNTLGNRIWNVAASPDLALSAPGTSLALELGFQSTGGNIISISALPNEDTVTPANGRVFTDQNTGNQIFTWQTTSDVGGGVFKYVGTQAGSGANATQAYAYLGTNVLTLAKNYDLLTITTDGSVTALNWGGAFTGAGVAGAPVASLTTGNGGIAQADTTNSCLHPSCLFSSFNGSLAFNPPTSPSATQRFLGDVNGDGRTNNFDVVPFGGILNPTGQAAYKTANPNLNFLRGDINGSGTVNNFDVVPFSNILATASNPSGSGSGLGSASVPEPASIALFGLGLAAAGLGRRRRR
jgi:hypothetical protein